MPDAEGKIRAAILAYPEVTASVVYTMHDLLCAAGRDWGFITTGVPGRQRIVPSVVAADRAQIRTGNGVWITPDYDFGDCPPPDIVCVPDFPLPADDPALVALTPRSCGCANARKQGRHWPAPVPRPSCWRRPTYWTEWRPPFIGTTRHHWPDITRACGWILTGPRSSPAKSDGSSWQAAAPAISI